MTRRDFLSTAAVTALAPKARAFEPVTMALGFSLYGMKALPLVDALAACARIGYDAVELACMTGYPGDPNTLTAADRKVIRNKIADLRLTLPALMENCPLDGDDTQHAAQLDRLKAAAELVHDLSPKAPPVLETILGGKPDEWDKVRDRFAARLANWAKLAEAAKAIIGIKAHRFGAVNRPEHVRWLLDQVKSDRLMAAYDWSHFEQRDMTMADTLKALGPVTRFVHVKDTVLEKGQARFVLPGAGSTDYPALVKGLQAQGYTGCVCVEVSGMVSGKKDYDPLAAAKTSFAVLSAAFTKAGVKRPG